MLSGPFAFCGSPAGASGFQSRCAGHSILYTQHYLAHLEQLDVRLIRRCGKARTRGRGLSRRVTSAVLDALEGIGAIGLNIRADNPAAIRVSESLRFVRHCPFIEALETHPDR